MVLFVFLLSTYITNKFQKLVVMKVLFNLGDEGGSKDGRLKILRNVAIETNIDCYLYIYSSLWNQGDIYLMILLVKFEI